MRLALAGVVVAFAAAACGGVENEPNLARAADRTEESGSFALAMTMRTTPDGNEITDTCEGVVDTERELAHLTCSGGAFGDLETVTIGDTTYTKDPASEGEWTKELALEEDPLDELAPSEILELLRLASRKTERLGEEDIRGEPTVRYALTVDCGKVELVDCAGGIGVVDVWLDTDGRVRRISFEEGGLAMRAEFFDFGLPVDVAPPPADKVTKRPPIEFAPCAAGDAEPIPVDEVLGALRRNGFLASKDEGSCMGPVAAFISANIEPNIHLACVVVAELPRGETETGFTIDSPDTVGERTLANVRCTILADQADADEALGRLGAAFDELKRELGP